MKTEINDEKIYRVQLVFDENDKCTVYATKTKEDAERIFNKLSENNNLKYILK